MPRSDIFTIPAHIGFVDALAAGLLARAGYDPLALARAHILLPNRRAVRALTDAFVRSTAAGGLLLPRMTPVGDLGDDSFARFADGDVPLPAALSPLQRRLQLARLVRAMPKEAGLARSAVEALRLGDALGSTLDALLEAEVDPEALCTVVHEAELAGHWGETLQFLDIVIRHWPPVRDRLGASDGGTRLAQTIDALVTRWQAQPPAHMVVAAGITNNSPPLARLQGAVLGLPHGMVVLQGLDDDLSDAGAARWEAIACHPGKPDDGPRNAEEHPQYALKRLLMLLGLERADVRRWGHTGAMDGPAARTPLVMAAMAPADAAEGWHASIADGLAGVTAVEAATPSEEAQVIGLALRQTLETPGTTAALVTPDRALARRVAAHCRRWGITLDDSAGTPLHLTPAGVLALAAVEAMAQGFAPVALLALLKHPLVAAGDGRIDWLDRVRRMDVLLRGVRPPPGLEPVAEQLGRAQADAARRSRRQETPVQQADRAARDAGLERWWADVAGKLAPLEALSDARRFDLPQLAAALRQTLSALAGDGVWAGEAGRKLAQQMDALESDGAVFETIDDDEAPAVMVALLSDVAVRPGYGGHPRLAILGLVEAQLQRADLMILSGLNEGTWPAKPAPDPWLAPTIRNRLGLPGLARATGLAAQDFVRGLGAPRVLLTRAQRDASAPLVPSRFWLRLDAFAGGLVRDDALLRLARRLDGHGQPAPLPMPRPAPLAIRRPQILNITDVDTLATDPFAFYARKLLGLSPLDPLDDDPSAATRGTLMHGVLEDWANSGGGSLERLEQLAEQMLLAQGQQFPLLRALWAPRARRALRWAGEAIHAREADGWQVRAAEAPGQLVLANGITLNGRADRVDMDGDGRLAVIDYKSGGVPSGAQVQNGLASQLGLLAAMAARGALKSRGGTPLAAGEPAEIAYWLLKGGKDPGKIVNPLGKKIPVTDHVAAILSHAEALTRRLLQSEAPFDPKVEPGLSWRDYDHLARVAEWQDRPSLRRLK